MRLKRSAAVRQGISCSLGCACALAVSVALAQDVVPVQPAAAPTPASAASAAADASAARSVAWDLQIEAPGTLAKLLRTYLDLARFQLESASDDSLKIRRSELRRLVAASPEQARGLLEAEGYFEAKIISRVGEEVPGKPVVVTITVDPGPKTVISKVQIVFEGELDERVASQDKQAQALADAVVLNWALAQGQPFRQAEWSAAKNGALAHLRAEGYPSATWSGTSVTVDAQTHEATLYLVADSGPRFAFGGIRVEGLVHQPASAITNLAPFNTGEAYNEKDLLDWQERVQKLNLFDNIFVTTDLDPTQAAASPVVVQVHEQPLQTATTGIGISSDTGPRVSMEYLNRNIFAQEWQAKTKLQLGRLESTGQLDLTSHPWPGRRRGLLSVQGNYLVDSANSVATSAYLRVGQLREGDRLERTDYIEFQRAEVQSADHLIVSNASAVSGTSQWIFRNVDSQILPTTGTTSLGQLTGGRTYSALNEAGYFGRTYARVTWYKPLWAGWYATTRGELGQVFARDQVSVPDTQLFRAGGDESVRGYAFRSLGVIKDGVVIGGRSIMTTSFEAGHPLLKRMPSLWGALFVDAGDAAGRFGDLQPKVGYGAGVRWRSPVGPLRLDLAYGTSEHRFRIHFSVGISL